MRDLILALIEGNTNPAIVEMAFRARSTEEVNRNMDLFEEAKLQLSPTNRSRVSDVMWWRTSRAAAITMELSKDKPSASLLLALFCWPAPARTYQEMDAASLLCPAPAIIRRPKED